MQRVAVVLLIAAVIVAGASALLFPRGVLSAAPAGVITKWETVGRAQGLPHEKVLAVLRVPEGVWAGTEDGLAFLEGTKVVRTYGEADGLSFRVITSLCRDDRNGTVYVGTMRGITKIAGGILTPVNESKDGLINDVVYSVCMQGENLWCATAAGLSRWNTDTGVWSSWTEKTAPMKEIWCYSVCHDAGKVWTAVWGSGLLEFDVATERWQLYLDPDKDMRFDLFRDDGLLSDVVVGASYANGVVWASSYLGLTRYDGRDWQTWVEGDGGLASSFLNAGRANGHEFWACTDKGLSQFDGSRWVTYRPGPDSDARTGEIVVTPDEGGGGKAFLSEGSLPDRFVWAVDFDGRDVWVGTSRGLAHGLRNGPVPETPVRAARR